MTENIQDIAKRLNACGLKVTPQRIAVMQVLSRLQHPRAEDIFREVSAGIPGLSPTTIYNILDVFAAHNLVRKVQTDADVMRYDAIADHHHHLYCMQSDRMEDYFDPELDALLKNYFAQKKLQGFKLNEIRLHIMGEFEQAKNT